MAQPEASPSSYIEAGKARKSGKAEESVNVLKPV